MTSRARASFDKLCQTKGSPVTYVKETGGTTCPCVSALGYRDPQWHIDHPAEPVCNEVGKLGVTRKSVNFKAFVQPVNAGATRRLTSEQLASIFGEVEGDDHIIIMPLSHAGVDFEPYDWSRAGEQFLSYYGRRFTVVNVNRIDIQGEPHHFELGLRLIKPDRPTD